ncbi:hypothetical protein [Frankia sp. AgB32]|uniref:hypothetical protein n=1 Tax=Frankia sp. AgB32 TaxID=631119 RepID=UPI00200BE550|nr:hypothetical protein [Frankia sp. AgB32]MCK9893276.1 hypothetical protein [Frankia sp. AgB32]
MDGGDGVGVGDAADGERESGAMGAAQASAGRPGNAARSAPGSTVWVLVGCALLAVLTTIVLAVADPAPSRHVRGLLVTADLVCLAGVGTAWLRVVLSVGAPRSTDRIE